MEPLSFFGRFVQRVKVSCFSDSFVQKTKQQKGALAEGSRGGRERKCTAGKQDGSCNVTSDSQLLYNFFKKQPLFLKTPTKSLL